MISNVTLGTGVVECATTTDAATSIATAYVHIETRPERYARYSNEWASAAARGMEVGADPELIEYAASAADHWANLAAAVRYLELAMERLP